MPKANFDVGAPFVEIPIRRDTTVPYKIFEGGIIMKFVKGILIGTVISAGVALMYSESSMNKRKVMKKGRKIAKKIGIM